MIVMCTLTRQTVHAFAFLYPRRIQRKENAMFSLFGSYRKSLFCVLAVLFMCHCAALAEEVQASQQVSDLQQAAKQCMKNKDYAGAREQYRQILRDYPDAIESQFGLIRASILMDDTAAAESETNNLLSNFSNHPDLPKAVCDVANTYFRTGHYAEADGLCETIIERWPNTDEAFFSRRILACSLIHKGQLDIANAATDKLVSDYASHPGIPKAVHGIAMQYLAAGQYSRAEQLCRMVIDNWPESNQVIKSRQTIAKSLIQQGDFAGAEAATDRLVSDYSSRPNIAFAIRDIADEFRWAKHHTGAAKYYRAVPENWPDAKEVLWCQKWLACSLIQQGDFSGAEAAADRLVSDYSSRSDIASAVRDIADKFRWAKHHTEAVKYYRAVLENWPDAKGAMWCQKWLACSPTNQGDFAGVVAEAKKLVSDHSDHPEISKVTYGLAVQYYMQKRHAEAAELCREILSRWPNSDQAFWARLMLLRAQIREGNSADGESAMAELLSEYASHPEIAKGHLLAGEEYFSRAQELQREGDQERAQADFQKAIDLWEKNRTGVDDPNHARLAYYHSATAYRYLKDYQKAAEYYELVGTQWPQFENAAASLLMSALFYERAAKENQADEVLYIEKAQEISKRLIASYPSSEYAEKAKRMFRYSEGN